MKTSYWRKFIEELIEKKYKTKEEYADGLMAEIKRMLEIIESADFAIEELSTRNIRLVEENKELKEELEKTSQDMYDYKNYSEYLETKVDTRDDTIEKLEAELKACDKKTQEIKELLLSSYETTSDRNEIIDRLKEENKELEKIIDRILEENHAIIDGIANGECCQYKALYEKQKQENEELILMKDNRIRTLIEERQELYEEIKQYEEKLKEYED